MATQLTLLLLLLQWRMRVRIEVKKSRQQLVMKMCKVISCGDDYKKLNHAFFSSLFNIINNDRARKSPDS
jgi:hypothetical protein